MSEETRPAHRLPDGAWCRILGRLDFQSRVNCCMVNRQLHDILSRPALWPSIELTFAQLVSLDDDFFKDDLRTPAARCIQHWHSRAPLQRLQKVSASSSADLVGTEQVDPCPYSIAPEGAQCYNDLEPDRQSSPAWQGLCFAMAIYYAGSEQS